MAKTKMEQVRQQDGRSEWVRALAEIEQAEEEMTDKVWYDRHQMLVAEAAEEGICADCAGLGEGEKLARELETKYGDDNFGCGCDYCQGIRAGKLSALRWVLGEEWDSLDT